MAGELAVRASSRALVAADAVQEQQEQRRLIGEYVKSQMVAGTDYGPIPGTTRPTLLKPGAEKLTQLFRCIPRLRLDDKVENWESGLFHYRFTCQIVTQGDDTVVAEGVGSASTYESRYRWRQGERRCPHCGASAIIKGKAEFGGGWLCFKKKSGCGAKFDDADPAVAGQSVERVQNPDLLDAVNTVLKIAKKRALVDAALSLARCSDIFTQDVEDMAEAGHDAPPPPPAAPGLRDDAPELFAEIAGCRTPDELRALGGRVRAEVKRYTATCSKRVGAAMSERMAALEAAGPTRPPDVPRIHKLLLDLDDLLGDPADTDAELRLAGCESRAAVDGLPPTAAMGVHQTLRALKLRLESEAHAATA